MKNDPKSLWLRDYFKILSQPGTSQQVSKPVKKQLISNIVFKSKGRKIQPEISKVKRRIKNSSNGLFEEIKKARILRNPPVNYVEDVEDNSEEEKHCLLYEYDQNKIRNEIYPNKQLVIIGTKKRTSTKRGFMQMGTCKEVVPGLNKCKECKLYNDGKKGQYFCRFYDFRKLKLTKEGTWVNDGFPDPFIDLADEDLKTWMPANANQNMTSDLANDLLESLGDQFCKLVQKEKESGLQSLNKVDKMIWKRVLEDIQELCDICFKEIFNYHWTCGKCGFVSCIDCYEEKKDSDVIVDVEKIKPEKIWAKCNSPKTEHQLKKLLLTQMIPGNCLFTLNESVHKTRETSGHQCLSCSKPEDTLFNTKKKNAGLLLIREETFNNITGNIFLQICHTWLCDGNILWIQDAEDEKCLKAFREQWKKTVPVVVTHKNKIMSTEIWSPEGILNDTCDEKVDFIECQTGASFLHKSIKSFWNGFISLINRPKNTQARRAALKLTDWPKTDFKNWSQTRYNDFINFIPIKEYTTPNGYLNLASKFESTNLKLKLGPKIYAAYASLPYGFNCGTINLQFNISDAVYLMSHSGTASEVNTTDFLKDLLCQLEKNGIPYKNRRQITNTRMPGALWHIYDSKDLSKIRVFLTKMNELQGLSVENYEDPMNHQWYLDYTLRERLSEELGVNCLTILQFTGDSIFIPPGSSFQVKYLMDSIIIKQAFVSPENVSHSIKLMEESNKFLNKSNGIDLRQIMYHSLKESLAFLSNE